MKLLIKTLLILSVFNIYSNKSGVTINPFTIVSDPMKQLLLMNMSKDADDIYIGFEPQLFDDEKNGSGLIVIAWRTDGMVDIYHDPYVNIDPAKYTITGEGLRHIIEREFKDSVFQITDKGVELDIVFYDINGRKIELFINENTTHTRKPFGLLAPMGDGAVNPDTLPLVLLRDFYFVRQKGTNIYVKIDGDEKKLDNLPVPIDYAWMTFTRYSSNPFIVSFNRNYNGLLNSIVVENTVLTDRSMKLEVDSTGNIEKIREELNDNILALEFYPGFPNLILLKTGETKNGTFNIITHETIGCISGKYNITVTEKNIEITMIPSKGWKPDYNGKISLRILYNIAGVFKNWPKSYKWTANIDRENFYMESEWERIKK